MNRYSLVNDISSDKEDNRHSTPIKSVSVNMVGKLNICDSSLEVWRTSHADLDSTFDSGFSPKKIRISPIKNRNKNGKVWFNLPTAESTDSDEGGYEEPDTLPKPSPVLKEITNAPPTEKKTAKITSMIWTSPQWPK